MKIVDRQQFLVLDYDIADNVHSLGFADSAEEVIVRWGANTRFSPIWPLRTDEIKEPKRKRKCVGIAFIGPINPALLENEYGAKLRSTFKTGKYWVTLGHYNLLLGLADNDEFESAREFSEKCNASCELWVLDKDGDVVTFAANPRAVDPHPSPLNSLTAQPEVDSPTLAMHLLELRTLVAATDARGSASFPWIGGDLVNLAQAVNKQFQHQADEVGKPHWMARMFYDLSNINAGLSRLASQMLSGTTPIMKTECHFWPHSLLGTGIANSSLRTIVDFVARAVGNARIPERVRALGGVAYTGPPLFNKKSAEFCEDVIHNISLPVAAAPLINPVTYYSGRDGFKNDTFTASAPLDSIESANSVMWNPTTITHELSHRIITPILAHLLPLSPEKLEEDEKLLLTVRQKLVWPRTYLEAARQYLVHLILAIAEHDGIRIGDVLQNGTKATFALLKMYEHEMEELLVHVFDFLYFFRGDKKEYVKSIWISWGAIPNISDRTEDYLLRTLVALAADKLQSADPIADARDGVIEVLEMASVSKQTPYAGEALEILKTKEKWEQISRKLITRIHIAQFARMFLYSDFLALEAKRDQFGGASPPHRYKFAPSEFTLDKFENPLLFLQEYANDDMASRAKSVWIHHMLAFNVAG